MPSARDYKAEYARRIARGNERGLTRNQARGHPEVGKPLVSGKALAMPYSPELEDGVKAMRGGKSLQLAAYSLGVSPERLRRYVNSQGVGVKEGGRWRIGIDHRLRSILLFSNGQEQVITVKGYELAKQVGEYMQAVKQFLATNDASLLNPYRGHSVPDMQGAHYVFETNENTLYRLHATSDSTFESIYRIVA
jgi:hypothetical protein